MTAPEPAQCIRVLAFVEATTVTGPAKNLLEFSRGAGKAGEDGLCAQIGVATFVRGRGSNAFLDACAEAGIPVTVIPERGPLDPSVLGAMRRLAAHLHPDIIQTHSLKSHFLVHWAGLGRRYRWIAFHHGYTHTNLKVRAYNQLDRISLPRAARVVTVCRAFAADLVQAGVPSDRILVCHNSIPAFAAAPPEAVRQLRRELGIAESAKVVLCVGRLSKEKGHADLISAWARLCQPPLPRPACLVIVGQGPERAALERAVAASGLAGSVIFAGQQAGVERFYSLADLLVLPSHTEGSPNVLLEAMAAGLPLVATRVGGVPEIVTHEREALLTGRHQPLELAAAMRRLLTDEPLCRGLGARAQSAARAYTAVAYREAILALYADCMGARAPSAAAETPVSPAARLSRSGGKG